MGKCRVKCVWQQNWKNVTKTLFRFLAITTHATLLGTGNVDLSIPRLLFSYNSEFVTLPLLWDKRRHLFVCLFLFAFNLF